MAKTCEMKSFEEGSGRFQSGIGVLVVSKDLERVLE